MNGVISLYGIWRRGIALMALAFFMFMPVAMAESAPVDVSIATISAASRVLAPGETLNLSVLSKYPAAADETLVWKSSKETVASVGSSDGTVTALKEGRATISLVGMRSNITLAICQVTVRVLKVSFFSISPRKLSIAPGVQYEMTAAVKPSNATYRNVSWTSTNPAVLSFDDAGTIATASGNRVKVYAHAIGDVKLVARTESGRKQVCAVKVRNLAVSSVKFPKSRRTVYLEDPAEIRLTASVSPSTSADTSVTYTSSVTMVADIDSVTGILTPHTTGATIITASAGGKSGACTVTVASKAIKSLSISTLDNEAVVLDADETAQLSAVASPSYAANRGVTWSTDDATVAGVDPATGVVLAAAGGVARITATSQVNPAVKASVTVHVRGNTVRTVTITAAGDAVLGGDPRPKGTGAANPHSDQEFMSAILKAGDDGAAGDGTVFARVASFFAGENNIATFNLEGTLTTKKSYGDKPFVFRGMPVYAATLLKAHNIDAVCIANNHTNDVGTAGYADTRAALKRNGVQGYGNGIVGSVTSENGLKVGFLGFVGKDVSVSDMSRQIRSAAKRFDMVVVVFHWTGVKEFQYANPSARQKSLARAAINAGADLVVGHHTHRLNGIERYKGRFIVYDLGNFVTIARNPLNRFSSSNPQGKYDYDSLIYRQKFNVWADGYVEASDITLIPCAITSAPKQQVNTCQPMAYSDSADIERVLNRIQSQSPSDYSDYPIVK